MEQLVQHHFFVGQEPTDVLGIYHRVLGHGLVSLHGLHNAADPCRCVNPRSHVRHRAGFFKSGVLGLGKSATVFPNLTCMVLNNNYVLAPQMALGSMTRNELC